MVRVTMLVSLPQVKPETDPHQHRRCPERQVGHLRPQEERNDDAEQRRE
jgi:hypothetical protein